MARRDDDALTWDGDDDPTLDVVSTPAEEKPVEVTQVEVTAVEVTPAHDPAAGPSPASLPAGWSAVGKGSEDVGATPDDEPVAVVVEDEDPAATETAPIGNAALIATGVLGGVYLLFAIGWLIGGLRLGDVANFLVADVIFQVSLWLSVLTPLVWFATVWIVTARKAAWTRFVWLAIGVVLLVPWPFIMIGAVGQ